MGFANAVTTAARNRERWVKLLLQKPGTDLKIQNTNSSFVKYSFGNNERIYFDVKTGNLRVTFNLRCSSEMSPLGVCKLKSSMVSLVWCSSQPF